MSDRAKQDFVFAFHFLYSRFQEIYEATWCRRFYIPYNLHYGVDHTYVLLESQLLLKVNHVKILFPYLQLAFWIDHTQELTGDDAIYL